MILVKHRLSAVTLYPSVALNTSGSRVRVPRHPEKSPWPRPHPLPSDLPTCSLRAHASTAQAFAIHDASSDIYGSDTCSMIDGLERALNADVDEEDDGERRGLGQVEDPL